MCTLAKQIQKQVYKAIVMCIQKSNLHIYGKNVNNKEEKI